MSAFVRSYAVSQYQKEFPTQDKLENAQKQMMKHVNAVREVYKPHRYYRRKTAPPPDLASRVQITLLEYGMHADAQSADKAEGAESLEQQQIDEVCITKIPIFLLVIGVGNLLIFCIKKVWMPKRRFVQFKLYFNAFVCSYFYLWCF